MSTPNRAHEHEFEPQYGLPERLPHGETLLWQGRPDVMALALRVFHVRKLACYFLVLLTLRWSFLYSNGSSGSELLAAMVWPVILTVLGLAAVTCLAWLTARTTVYTLTNRRVVMRIGIVLTLTFNLPLRSIESAGWRMDADGCGDIPLRLKPEDRIAWLQLWPHVRPWSLARPEPTLRCVANVRDVAALMASTWSEATGHSAAVPSSPQVDESTALPWRPSLT